MLIHLEKSDLLEDAVLPGSVWWKDPDISLTLHGNLDLDKNPLFRIQIGKEEVKLSLFATLPFNISLSSSYMVFNSCKLKGSCKLQRELANVF